MSKTGEKDKVPPPPLNEDGNPIVGEDDANTETSMALTLEELMRRLEELTAENKQLRDKAKNKKTKKNSSSRKEGDSSFEEDVSKKKKKGRRNCDKPSYNSMSFNYNNMSSSTVYTFIPVGKILYFYGNSYNKWKHCMKNYLYSI
jgi:predicted RNase H-like nuclease (RuvC/YqgF family)